MKPTTLLVTFLPILTQAQYGQKETLCGQYQSYTADPYIFNNNLWGQSNGNGSQCTFVFSAGETGVSWTTTWTWSEPKVKSYANSGYLVPKGNLISNINTLPTTAKWKYNKNITGDVAYDLFTSEDPDHTTSSGDYELMIWLARYDLQPIGHKITTVDIAGIAWEVWCGGSSMRTYTFVAYTPVQEYSGDIMDFFRYLTDSHGFPASQQNLLTFQFGTEPVTGQQATLTVSSWTASMA